MHHDSYILDCALDKNENIAKLRLRTQNQSTASVFVAQINSPNCGTHLPQAHTAKKEK